MVNPALLPEKSFEIWSANNKYEVEKSEVDILVGGNPYSLLHQTINTVEQRQ